MSTSNIFNILSTSADQRSKYQSSTNDKNQHTSRPKSQIQSVADHPGYKTQLCKWFEETGTCTKGFRCGFAHGTHQLRKKQEKPQYTPKPLNPELYKTQMCKWVVQNGHCTRGDKCAFAHNQEELTFHKFGESKPAPPMSIAQQTGLVPLGCVKTMSIPTQELTAQISQQQDFDLFAVEFPELPVIEVLEAVEDSCKETRTTPQSKSWADTAEEECC